MKTPRLRKVIFHGEYADKYIPELEIYADTMVSAITIIFKNAFPELLKEGNVDIVIEDVSGNKVALFDPEQELHKTQTTIHIMPNPDGAYIQILYAVIVAIVSIGIALLLAPKANATDLTGSGSNFDSVDNVVGQGGAMQVVLGERRVGSRVVSHGYSSQQYVGRSSDYVS